MYRNMALQSMSKCRNATHLFRGQKDKKQKLKKHAQKSREYRAKTMHRARDFLFLYSSVSTPRVVSFFLFLHLNTVFFSITSYAYE